jgi:outer membrane receptor for ferrienterochelin and colicin
MTPLLHHAMGHDHALKSQIAWKFNENGQLQFSSQQFGKTLNAGGIASGYSSLNLSYGYKLTPTYEVFATITNIAGATTYGDMIRSARFVRQTELRVPGQIIFIGLKYKFGAIGSVK